MKNMLNLSLDDLEIVLKNSLPLLYPKTSSLRCKPKSLHEWEWNNLRSVDLCWGQTDDLCFPRSIDINKYTRNFFNNKVISENLIYNDRFK